METRALTLYDNLILEGKIEGKIETSLEVTKKLLRKLPHFTDQEIHDISNAPLKEIAKMRRRLAAKKQ